VNHAYHRLSHDAFAALASGGGSSAISELTGAEYSKHVILLRGVLTAASGSAAKSTAAKNSAAKNSAGENSEQYERARGGYDLLAAALRENRAAAEKVIAYPTVGTWARRTILACRGAQAPAGAMPEMLCAVGAAAAIRAGLSAQIEVSAVGGQVALPTLGAALVPGPEARVPGHRVLVRTGGGSTTAGSVEIPEDPHRDAPGWLGLRRVRAGRLDILIDDLDPFRMPDLTDLAPRQDTAAWDAALQEAWRVLERHHPAVAAEAATAVSAIVPRSRPASGEVSTSSAEAFGAIALSLPPDPVTFAVTFAHELQHLKLGALLDVVTLTMPDDGRRYYAPWRDDPRPLYGLLQGAYAYLGVSGFWRRQRTLPGEDRLAGVEYARWRLAAARAVETIRSSGRLTGAGLEFTAGMARTLNAWCDEPLPEHAEATARRKADAHQDQWQSANGPIPVY
jgi:HEXXH motif-containing protein